MPRVLQPCGTTAAYRRHLRAGEDPCEPCKLANREKKRNEARPPLGDDDDPRPPSWRVLPASTPDVLDDLDETLALVRERSEKGDLEFARDLLMAAMVTTYKADPTRLPPIVKELRETWKALSRGSGEEEGGDDEFTRALQAREAARAAGA